MSKLVEIVSESVSLEAGKLKNISCSSEAGIRLVNQVALGSNRARKGRLHKAELRACKKVSTNTFSL